MSERPDGPAGGDGAAGNPTSGRYVARHARQRPQHIPSRRWPRRLLIAANIVVALSLLAAGGVYGYINWRFDQIHRIKVASLIPQGSPANTTTATVGQSAPVTVGAYTGSAFTVLVVGSDSRAGLTPAEAAEFNSQSNPVTGERSDTVILMRVDPAAGRINMMSIPRDLWVPIKGTGQYAGSYQKINAAFDSGPNDLVKTIEDDLGVPINHYIEINFNAFMQITNAVGGVKQYFPTAAKDSYSLLNIPAAGCYNLNGAEALQFVRARHYEYKENGYWQFEASSDLARIERQQMFIKKIISKAKSAGLGNPLTLNSIVGGITTNLTVDSGFSRSLLLELAKRFRSIDANTIPTQTYPTYAENNYGPADGQDILLPEHQADAAAVAAFMDTVPPATSSSSTTTSTTRPSTTTTTGHSQTVKVAPSSVSVEVLNGSGVTSQGGQVAQLLRNNGFVVPFYGDADTFDYANTVIRYKPSALAKAEYVRSLIIGKSTLQSDSELSGSDLVVVTGKSFKGVRTAHGVGTVTIQPGAASTTTTTSTTVPRSSGVSTTTTTTVYQLPGTTKSDASAAAACGT